MNADKIIAELEARPIEKNIYRKLCGEGRSQAFGVVNRRCLPPDYSRWCWRRPGLYALLMEFAEQNFPDFPYTSITVNQNYQCAAHRDKGNIGDSIVVAFGEYEGGELILHEGPQKGKHNINLKPIQDDFNMHLHEVAPFKGNRYSLVYYTIPCDVPPPSVIAGKFYRGGVLTACLPHPLHLKKAEEVMKQNDPRLYLSKETVKSDV